MRRLLAVLTGIVLLTLTLGNASAGAQATGKVLTATGTVSAISPNSITIKGKNAEWTLNVDTKTDVIGKGVGTKSAQMKEEKKPTRITDFIKTGDEVTVSYQETSKLATRVRLVRAAPPAK